MLVPVPLMAYVDSKLGEPDKLNRIQHISGRCVADVSVEPEQGAEVTQDIGTGKP